MKSTKWIAMAVALAVLMGFATQSYAAASANGDKEDKIIAQFNKKLDHLIEQCERGLLGANSAQRMDDIAAKCETQVFALLGWLEDQLGYAVAFETFDICVYNEALDYTACYDPIHIN